VTAIVDFEKIPLWNADSPESSFEITSDAVNGRIPVTRIERWQELNELLENDFFNKPNTQYIFRGHRRFDWGLMPTLARVTENGIIEKSLADEQLDHFKRAVRGRVSDRTLVEEDDELWAVGQHYGLMTPLLDWTYSPYVALFFAFHREDSLDEPDNPYRTIYVLNKTFVADDTSCPEIRVFEPRKDDHGRLVNQAGLFTFSPYGSTIENKLTDTLADEDFQNDALRSASEDEQPGILARYICKIYIKNEDRDGCIRHLRRMNVHHASLFPDLIGASEYCNLIISEQQCLHEIDERKQASQKQVLTNDIANKWPEDELLYRLPNEGNINAEAIAVQLGGLCHHALEKEKIEYIAMVIAKQLSRLMVVDWKSRESILEQMTSSIRIVLRKLGYPSEIREQAVNAIMDLLDSSSDEPV